MNRETPAPIGWERVAVGWYEGRFMASSWSFRPVEVPVQKTVRSLSVDGVRPVEEFDLGPVRQAELRVKAAHARELVRDPFIRRHTIVMAAFDHEWPRRDQRGHLRIIEGVREVKLVHVIFDRVEITVGGIDGGAFGGPLVEVGG